MLGFYKKLKSHYLIIWFQCSQDGFDQFAGSKFIVETQIGNTTIIGNGLTQNSIFLQKANWTTSKKLKTL